MRFELDIPEGDFAGYIFDCDGTLADTMPLHYEAWRATLDAHGGENTFPLNQFYAMGGVSSHDIIQQLNRDHGLQMNAHEVSEAKETEFRNRLTTVDPIPEVTEYARMVAKQNPVSVVSGGLKPIVLKTLTLIGMEGFFNPVVTPEDVERGKPHPDMFLLAAEKMGVPPEKCLVFEDGPSGIEGARAAGMSTVLVPSPE